MSEPNAGGERPFGRRLIDECVESIMWLAAPVTPRMEILPQSCVLPVPHVPQPPQAQSELDEQKPPQTWFELDGQIGWRTQASRGEFYRIEPVSDGYALWLVTSLTTEVFLSHSDFLSEAKDAGERHRTVRAQEAGGRE